MCYKCEQANQVTTEFWDPEEQPLSIAELADAVRRASILNPDKVYERPTNYSGCLYTHDVGDSDSLKTPGCIVGQGVFDVTGKVVNQMALSGRVCNSSWMLALSGNTCEFDSYGDPIIEDPLTRYLVSWLRAVQEQQDDDRKWSDAVAYADRSVQFSTYAS